MQTHTGTMVDPAGRFGRLVDAMPDGIVLAELSGRIVYVNYVLGRMSGSSGEKLRGQPVEVIVPARVREALFQHCQAYTSAPRMRPVGTGLEISLQPKDGTELPADIALSPFATETGSLVVATVRDATERKRAEEGEKAALKERQRLARELHDSVSQVLYGIALGSETARDLLARDPARAREPLEFIHRLAEAGLTEMRALTFELRPESLAQDGLVATLTNQLTAMRARHCINVDKILPIEPVCSLAVKEAVFRIAQEALHNVVKHARRPGSNSISSVTTRGLRSTSATTASASTWGRSFRDISACRPCASGRSAWAVPLTCRPRPVTGPGSALCSATQAEG